MKEGAELLRVMTLASHSGDQGSILSLDENKIGVMLNYSLILCLVFRIRR